MGNISCEAKEINQSEIQQDKKEKISLQINVQKSLKQKKSKKINKSKTGLISHKILNKKDIKKTSLKVKKVINPKRKANIKEKNRINFNKDIKAKISNNQKRYTISVETKIKPIFMKNAPKFQKRKTFNKSISPQKKIIEIKKQKINYNDASNSLSNELNDDELIIYNSNDELDESIQILDYCNSDRKSGNRDLKEKISKTKEKIISIKNDLKNSKNFSEPNIIKKETNKTNNKITININDNINNNILINNINNIKNETLIPTKDGNNSANITNNNNITGVHEYFNSNIENMELNELLTNGFSIKHNNTQRDRISIIENNNKKLFFSEKALTLNIIKKDFIQGSLESKSKIKLKNNTMRINKNEKIINKIKEINNKINNKITTEKRKTFPIFESKFSKKKGSETMDNKQIKNNIPSYRRFNSKSNICSSNISSCTYDKNKNKRARKIKSSLSLENSFNKSLYNPNLKSNIKKNNIYSNIYSFKRRKTSKNKNSKGKYNVQQSYLNNSSIINISTNDINFSNNKKNNKNQRLYNIITKNIINNFINQENNINNNDIIKNDNIDQILFYQFRDVAEIDISSINIKESLIDINLIKSHINNKIIVNYSKLDNYDKSKILFDGILYKIVENQNKFKMAERYFQIKKNCFRYYNNYEKGKNDSENPLVQFDIRHIKKIDIIDSKVFKQYKIKEREIEFTFCIYLNQNDDFFVFVFNNKIFGNSVYNFLNLLKNYYYDKK